MLAFLSYLGALYGAITFALTCFVWNIVVTIIREKQLTNRSLLNIIFSTSITLPFTAYGCYCSPKYGQDGRTNNLEPIDELDTACKKHDSTMIGANYQLMINGITKSECAKLKNKGDWKFMKEVLTSNNYASGMYLIGLEVGFLFRILSRILIKS